MTIEQEIKTTVSLDLAKSVLLNIFFARNVLADCFQEILKPYGISTEQYNVLRILRGQKGKPANMSLIQDRMITKNSNTTRLIDKLLIKEMVTRKECCENRRKIEILITDKGLKVLSDLEIAVIDHENKFASNLSNSELEQINFLLEKYRKIN
jgi:DNA-binding MarR family transcriptional regulator